MDGSPHPQNLDYAPRSSFQERNWRRVGWVVLIGLIAFFFVRVGPLAWRNFGILIAQNRCLKFQSPSDQVVLSSTRVVTAPQWVDFYDRLSPPGAATRATLFLHERISPSGNRRLVYLGGSRQIVTGGEAASMDLLIPSAKVFILGTPASTPHEILNPGSSLTVRGELFAGQPDSSDASHFTIRMRHDGMETILDGWLRDDDTVLIEPRPAQPLPSTASGSN